MVVWRGNTKKKCSFTLTRERNTVVETGSDFVVGTILRPAWVAVATAETMQLSSRLFSSLKKECIKKCVYKTCELARADVFDYIEVFYNQKRRYSHLGGVSPKAFEQASFWGSDVPALPRALHWSKPNVVGSYRK